MKQRFLGRQRTFDIPPRRARDTAHKTELARFKGGHIAAEREGGELVIYALYDEHGMPATTITKDKGGRVLRTLADLNRRNAAVHQRRA